MYDIFLFVNVNKEAKLLKINKTVVAFNIVCAKKIAYVIDLYVGVINQTVRYDNVIMAENIETFMRGIQISNLKIVLFEL